MNWNNQFKSSNIKIIWFVCKYNAVSKHPLYFIFLSSVKCDLIQNFKKYYIKSRIIGIFLKSPRCAFIYLDVYKNKGRNKESASGIVWGVVRLGQGSKFTARPPPPSAGPLPLTGLLMPSLGRYEGCLFLWPLSPRGLRVQPPPLRQRTTTTVIKRFLPRLESILSLSLSQVHLKFNCMPPLQPPPTHPNPL